MSVRVLAGWVTEVTMILSAVFLTLTDTRGTASALACALVITVALVGTSRVAILIDENTVVDRWGSIGGWAVGITKTVAESITDTIASTLENILR